MNADIVNACQTLIIEGRKSHPAIFDTLREMYGCNTVADVKEQWDSLEEVLRKIERRAS